MQFCNVNRFPYLLLDIWFALLAFISFIPVIVLLTTTIKLVFINPAKSSNKKKRITQTWLVLSIYISGTTKSTIHDPLYRNSLQCIRKDVAQIFKINHKTCNRTSIDFVSYAHTRITISAIQPDTKLATNFFSIEHTSRSLTLFFNSHTDFRHASSSLFHWATRLFSFAAINQEKDQRSR